MDRRAWEEEMDRTWQGWDREEKEVATSVANRPVASCGSG
jgi:hypothetical protein